MKKTTIIIDDHSMLRNGLKSFLEANSDWTVAGEAGSGPEAFHLLSALPELPAAAIVDISLPDMDGIELVRNLSAQYPGLCFVMYSMHVTAEYIQSAMRAGACAYVSKSSPSDDVLNALESVLRGDPYLDSYALKIHLGQYAWNSGRLPAGSEGAGLSTSLRVFGRPQNPGTPEPVREALTFQEGRVFALAAKNMTNAEIAQSLSLKLKTVENYMSIIYQKLALKNRYELLVYARKSGVLV
jgi:DNA-binding NarL/FixJ family response regulator